MNSPSSSNLPDNWRVFDDADTLASYAAEAILECAREAIAARGGFHLVTAGGSTPLAIYRLLASRKEADWALWHLYMGDERCLPLNDAQRNSTALEQAWLANSPIPVAQIHLMPAELGATQAAKLYAPLVRNRCFDMVLLGMGEDGHTASLFPGHDHSEEAADGITGRWVQCEFHSPKPPAERVTLSAETLGSCRKLLKLVTGQAKREAVASWLQGENLPISLINGQHTDVLISQESLPPF